MSDLRRYLKENKIKLRTAARQLESTPSTISKVCNGANPSIALARRIYLWSGRAVNLLEPGAEEGGQ